jgi:hypothetical protein
MAAFAVEVVSKALLLLLRGPRQELCNLFLLPSKPFRAFGFR